MERVIQLHKAVVTEALGFVGFQLCRCLLGEGIEVAAIDELGGNKEKENKHDYFGRNALFTFFEGKSSHVDLEKAFAEADVCFYINGRSGISTQAGFLHKTIGAVSENIRALLGKVSGTPPLFVLASSTEIYGETLGKVEETADPLPASPGGIVSLVEEALFLESEVPLSILRLPEIYGPDQPSDGSFNRLLRGEPPIREPLDVLYIEDAVKALFSAADKSASGIFNVGSGKDDQWLQGQRYIIPDESRSDKSDDSPKTWFAIEKATKAFDFQPATPLEKGIDIQKRQMRTE